MHHKAVQLMKFAEEANFGNEGYYVSALKEII